MLGASAADEIKVSPSTQGGIDARTGIADNFSELEYAAHGVRPVIRSGLSV
jgi:hypothetical protein